MTEWTRTGLNRLLVDAYYLGPFGRLADWLLAIDPGTLELRREVPDGGLREWLARGAEWADRRWIEHYVKAGRNPPDRWKRKEEKP